MQIVPIKDLKDTVGIEKKCKDGPVFVTKNGYGRLVVMDIDYYEKLFGQIEEAAFVNQGIKDVKEGKTADGEEFLKEARKKYGI